MPRRTPLEVVASKWFTLASMAAGQARTGRPARSATGTRRILPGWRESNLQAALHGQAASARLCGDLTPCATWSPESQKTAEKPATHGRGPSRSATGMRVAMPPSGRLRLRSHLVANSLTPFSPRGARPPMVLTAWWKRWSVWTGNCRGKGGGRPLATATKRWAQRTRKWCSSCSALRARSGRQGVGRNGL